MLADKTILIVSSNNSAVENIAEKLDREGLGFLVALLGNTKNKENFVSKQQLQSPDMADWLISNTTQIESRIKDLSQKLSTGFTAQERVAELKAAYDALTTEMHHHNMLDDETSPDISWLVYLPSSKLMSMLNLYRIALVKKGKIGFWDRLKYTLRCGRFKSYSLLKLVPEEVIKHLEHAYYQVREVEIEEELTHTSRYIEAIDFEESIKELSSLSLQVLKNKIAQRYHGKNRLRFSTKGIKNETELFLQEYPIVLSSTYSAKNCINQDMVFDYVIMDEASQIDIKTGALSLSCGINAVIVGDEKQLPNVVTEEDTRAIEVINTIYQIDERYNALNRSFLQSCTEVFQDAPVTLLREHYRCHPKIIEFCNQRFYGGELITMTSNSDETKALQVVRTVVGNHARIHFNQREIDVIVNEVMPQFQSSESIGIITPYRKQAIMINKALGQDIASTVHRFQGRECDTIIMSMVDNSPTSFSDDANLLNVAISRAKKHLCIVATGNRIPESSNLAQLISYIEYNNFEVKESRLRSVFDLLYQNYTKERLAYQREHPRISEFLSENLIYDILIKALNELRLNNLSVVCHYPLSRLIAPNNALDPQELAFVTNHLSHVDFLIYNALSKQPLLAVEVDGHHFHKQTIQQSRDQLKDQILSKCALPLYRISTTDTVTVETVKTVINNRLCT